MIPIPDFSSRHVTVVGDVMLDLYYWGDVRRISPEAPVPICQVRNITRVLGGAGNTARNLAGLRCAVSLSGVCGKDSAGAALAHLVKESGIDGHLFSSPELTTTTKSRIVGQGQQLLRLDEEDIRPLSEALTAKLIKQLRTTLANTDAVILSDYGKGLFQTDLAQTVIQICRNARKPVFVDPKGKNWERYHNATCITPNLVEFNQQFDTPHNSTEDLDSRARDLIKKRNLDYLLITMGAKGMVLYDAHRSLVQTPARSQEVIDVSGAGDTVIATLTGAVADGCTMIDAAALANAAAGVVVTKLGTQAITISELQTALLKQELHSAAKVESRESAHKRIEQWRADGKRIVFTNGCFDILHMGHIKLLQSAAQQGDKLVVAINSDDSVRRLKGASRPVMSESSRAGLMANIQGVDLVVIFDEDTPLQLIELFKPDVLVKGGDYTPQTVVGHELVTRWGGEVVLIDLMDGISTTRVIEQLNGQKAPKP